jgi:hypothetical protein|tara:strand:- start:11 stop:601 length:591 start_codon:yes stop_codon:yes gene_type:complete
MANKNSSGFGLIPTGTLGSTPSTQGQGKYYIEAAYGTSMFQGTSVRVVNGYVTTAQAAITNTTIGVLNGVFYNAATTLKPTWQNYYSDVTPANSENTTAFVLDNPFQLYNVSADAAVPQADHLETYGLTVTAAGSTTSGQSSSELTYSTRDATANQWRLLRSAEDPENQDITAANCTFVVVQNLNQVNSGGLTTAS